MNIGFIPAKYAALDPRRTAIIDVPNDRRTSFGELDRRVRRLANGLLACNGVARGARVAILARNCIEYLELFYACGRAGLIAQPMNWRLAVPEMARILREGEPAAMLSSVEFREPRDELQNLVDVPHWLEFGPASDGSYEESAAGCGRARAGGFRSHRRRRSGVHPLHRRHDGRVQGRTARTRASSTGCSTRRLPNASCRATSTCSPARCSTSPSCSR